MCEWVSDVVDGSAWRSARYAAGLAVVHLAGTATTAVQCRVILRVVARLHATASLNRLKCRLPP
jgi:hypothetical protein